MTTVVIFLIGFLIGSLTVFLLDAIWSRKAIKRMESIICRQTSYMCDCDTEDGTKRQCEKKIVDDPERSQLKIEGFNKFVEAQTRLEKTLLDKDKWGQEKGLY